MEITRVTVHKNKREDSYIKAYVNVTVDDAIAINDITIRERKDGDGLYISFPNRRLPSGDKKDLAHPINKEVRAMFEKEIFEAYEKAEDETTDEEEE